jgi:hypothetical protein
MTAFSNLTQDFFLGAHVKEKSRFPKINCKKSNFRKKKLITVVM